MAVNPKLVLAIVESARNEKIRRIVLCIILFALGLIMLIFAAYGGMMSGVFCIVQNAKLKADWSYYSKSISSVFDDIKCELDDDLKSEVYDFMPDFSSALSKAIISGSSDNPVAFDENDVAALTNSGHIARYTYTADTIETDDGNKASRQVLAVIDGEASQTVEYICVGGTIYLPEFLAMYNVHQNQQYLLNAGKENTSDVDSKLEEIVGNIPNNEEDFAAYMKDVWKSTIEGVGSANVGFFKTAALKSIIKEAKLDGAATVDIRRTDKKLSITLETINSETWKKVFQIDESLWDYVEQEKMTIEMALNAAQIPQSDRSISLDSIVQSSLFGYFDGIFEVPVSSSKVRGILDFGELSNLHTNTEQTVIESGMVMQLADKASVDLILQENCDSFIENAFIYDVWDMDEQAVTDNSKLYNHSAVTIAYVIDVKKFRKSYGFPFPDVDGVVTDSGYVTLFVEFSCLSSTDYQNKDVASSISVKEEVPIGKSHNGELDSKLDTGKRQHSTDNCTPHLTVKVNIRSGKTDKPSAKKESGSYDGLSAHVKGTAVNPRLWIKGLGLGTYSMPNNVTSVQPK